MTPVLLSVVPEDIRVFGCSAGDWGRRVARQWAEKGTLP